MLGLAIINLCTKLEVSTFTHYKDTKSNTKKCRNWGGLGGYGSSMLITNTTFDRAHIISYSTLIETMHLSCTVFDLQQVICQKWPILTYHTCICHPQILQRSLATENLKFKSEVPTNNFSVTLIANSMADSKTVIITPDNDKMHTLKCIKFCKNCASECLSCNVKVHNKIVQSNSERSRFVYTLQ